MEMKVHGSIADLASLPGPVALAIGVFDGVHLGHQAVIASALEHAAQHGGTAVVLTFDPHPLHVLRPSQAPRLLCSARHQRVILGRLGVEHLVVQSFDENFAATPADVFVAQLATASRPLSFISVGFTWRFGARGAGDIHLLMDAGQRLGFGVYGVPPVTCDGTVVSSTLIREAVSRAEFDTARSLLGRDYTVLGEVVRGRQLGRTIGVPTANIAIEAEQLPPTGVYAVRVLVDGRCQNGVANLGRRPTVGVSEDLSLEVHLLDFDGDLYGRDLEVSFVTRLRDEQKFDGLEALKTQIALDIAAARGVFADDLC